MLITFLNMIVFIKLFYEKYTWRSYEI